MLGFVEASDMGGLRYCTAAMWLTVYDLSAKKPHAMSPQAVTMATVATSHPTRHDPLLVSEASSFKLPSLSLPTQRSVFDQLMQRENVYPVGATQSHIQYYGSTDALTSTRLTCLKRTRGAAR